MKRELKTISTSASPSELADQEGATNGKSSSIRYISAEKHQGIKRRVLALHDGLLRRLAEYDRQR